ncbi:MAG TPA: hypothetical protein VIY08_01155 [Candidatus Nitrosocosmicus sp.]
MRTNSAEDISNNKEKVENIRSREILSWIYGIHIKKHIALP